MTIIAALHDPDRCETWIGSDTVMTRRGARLYCGPKWVQGEGWAIGIAGDWRTHNILAERRASVLADVASPFDLAERLRALLAQFDYDMKPPPSEATQHCAQDFLVATKDGVWSISSDFSVIDVAPFFADGSGCQFAQGAMRALYNAADFGPSDVLRAGLQAAIDYDIGCGGDIWHRKLEA